MKKKILSKENIVGMANWDKSNEICLSERYLNKRKQTCVKELQ